MTDAPVVPMKPEHQDRVLYEAILRGDLVTITEILVIGDRERERDEE